MSRYQIIIGRAEQVDFIGTALQVSAKIDSGAYRSSVHATGIKEVKVDGVPTLRFTILGHPVSPVQRQIETDRFAKLQVTSSNGAVEMRYEVTFKIKIGSKIFNTSFTLADRSKTLYPVLIGRKALKNRYVVDVAKSSVNRLKLKSDFGINTPHDEEDWED